MKTKDTQIVGLFIVDGARDREDSLQRYVNEASKALSLKLRSYIAGADDFVVEGDVATVFINLKNLSTKFVLLPGISSYIGSDITGTAAKNELLLMQHLAEEVMHMRIDHFDEYFGDNVAGTA